MGTSIIGMVPTLVSAKIVGDVARASIKPRKKRRK
jgi:hypothetical protein